MNKTAIEYLTHVWNSVTGCSPVSAGCEHCWAKRQHERFSKEPFSKVTLHPDRLEDPLRRRKPARIGVCFSGDLFHEMVPISFIAKVFNVMRNAEGHQFLLLTKRPQRMAVILGIWKCKGNNFGWVEEPLSNVWLGVSVENQPAADERIPWLLKTPAAHRWVSIEPCISSVDLSQWLKGDKSHDRIREGVYGLLGDRGFLDRRGGSDLEIQETYRGKQNREVSNQTILERHPKAKSGEVHLGWIPSDFILRRKQASQGICASCSLDVSQSAGHPTGDAGESQEWYPGRCETNEPGSSNSIRECDPQHKGLGTEIRQETGRIEPDGEANARTRYEGSISGGSIVSEENSRNDGVKTANNIECYSSSHMEAFGLDWVVMGGESGPGARPMHPDWARSARDQCVAAGVPFWFKSWGEFIEADGMPEKYPSREIWTPGLPGTGISSDAVWMRRVGHKAAGRMLDGRQWLEMPFMEEVQGEQSA